MKRKRLHSLRSRGNPELALQGLYYVATGLWPIFHMRSFEAVTGPKHDKWLVKTVGTLVTTIGSTLLLSAFREPFSEAARFLGVSSAVALTGIDTIYAAKGTIPKIYLADAAAEIFIAAMLMRRDLPSSLAARNDVLRTRS
jgi:hypothetical protein